MFSLPSWSQRFGVIEFAGLWGPAVLAWAVAVAGGLVGRRRAWVPPIVCVAAVLIGWVVLLRPSWRDVVSARGIGDRVLLLAAVLLVGGFVGGWVRSRWVAVAVAVFGAWWLAGLGMVGREFWRVGFGAVAVTWVLTRAGAREPGRAAAVGLVVLGGAWLADAPESLIGMVLVLLGGIVGVWVGGSPGVVPPALLMVVVVSADLGGGRLVREGVGLMDLACAGSLAAPLLVPRVERWLKRRFGRAAGVLATAGVSAMLLGVAWVAMRVRLR